VIGRIHRQGEEATFGDDRVWTSSDAALAEYLNLRFGREMASPSLPPAGHVALAAERLGMEHEIERMKHAGGAKVF
jgi:hypothetical protein